MRRDRLIIFIKAPRLGFVKTRLAKEIGNEAALVAYRSMLQTLFGNLAEAPDVELLYSPDDARAEISEFLRPAWSAAPQGGGDLGQRLTAAFRNAERVVVIGSDCPDVTAADISSAFAALETQDVVLGPAEDGGYWLIGLRAEQPRLFENISWSSDLVLKQTLEKAAALNLKVHLLRTLADIDTGHDLRRHQQRSAQQ